MQRLTQWMVMGWSIEGLKHHDGPYSHEAAVEEAKNLLSNPGATGVTHVGIHQVNLEMYDAADAQRELLK